MLASVRAQCWKELARVVAQQPKSMVLNIYGAYGRRLGGWISVAGLVALGLRN